MNDLFLSPHEGLHVTQAFVEECMKIAHNKDWFFDSSGHVYACLCVTCVSLLLTCVRLFDLLTDQVTVSHGEGVLFSCVFFAPLLRVSQS